MNLSRRSFGGATLLASSITMTIALIAPVVVSAAQPPIRLSISYGSECLYGTSASSTTVDIRWRDSAGALKAQGSTESNGFWGFCSGDDGVVIEIGDKLRLSDGSFARNYVVPDLSIEVDRVSNIFRGTGPAGRTIKIGYVQGLLGDYEETHGVRVGQDGLWSYDPDFDIPGGQFASLYWKSPNGDDLTTDGQAPEIQVTIGESTARGWADQGTTVRLVLRDGVSGARKAIANDVVAENGAIEAVFRNEAGQRVAVAAGDRVRGRALADDLDWIVSAIDGSADVAQDMAWGTCHDRAKLSGTVMVEIHRTGKRRGYAFTGLDSNGHFQVDFDDRASPGFNPANIKHGDRMVVRCRHATGDWFVQSFNVQ